MAKLFGFKYGAIAQGLWSASKCLAVLQEAQAMPKYPLSIAFEFHRPLYMPSNVVLYYNVGTAGHVEYQLRADVKEAHLHVTGTVANAPDIKNLVPVSFP